MHCCAVGLLLIHFLADVAEINKAVNAQEDTSALSILYLPCLF